MSFIYWLVDDVIDTFNEILDKRGSEDEGNSHDVQQEPDDLLR